MIRTLVFGAGRMARSLMRLAPEYPEVLLVGQVSRAPPEAGRPGLPYFETLDDAAAVLAGEIDLLVDFSLPEGTLAAANWCAGRRVAMLSGVTGIGSEVHVALDRVAKSAPVLWAANLSFGINLLAGILREIGPLIDPAAPVIVEETHHRGKKDAPSGTALLLARHLQPPGEGRAGTDPGRTAEDFPGIEFVSRREGDVIGDHSLVLRLQDETLTFAHHAEDRRLFARGALEAGQWLVGQPPGRYSAGDWIRSSAGMRPSGGGR